MGRNKVDNEKLRGYLESDIKLLGLPTDFTLELRGFSKSYYGRYYIPEKRIVVYILDEEGKEYPYHELLDTVLHEAIHHYQHCHQKGFVRLKGVMHDSTFKRIYEEKVYKLRELEVMPCA